MKDNEKTKEQLVKELTELRSQDAVLEKTRKELAATKISEDAALEYAESIINTVREPLIALDQDLRVVKVSSSFYDFFKVKPEDTVGQLIYDLGNKQWDIPKLRELLETILPRKATFDNYEVEHEFATIGRRTMLLNARQIKRVFGKERIILLAIEDITARKRLENILTESEELYRGVFRTASDGILLLEKREGKIIHTNPAAEKMLGYTNKECIGNKLQNIGFMLDMGDFQTTMQDLNKNGIINYTDVPVTTKSGQHMDADIYLVDKTKVVQCNIRDITDRKRAEEELGESETLFRKLFEEHAAVKMIIDPDTGNILDANEAAAFFYGWSREQLKRMKIQEINTLSPEEVKKKIEMVRAKKKIHFEFRHRRADGSVRDVDVFSSRIETNKKDFLHSIIHDITDRKRAEAALLESEEKVRSYIERAPDGVFIIDDAGRYIEVNKSTCRITGYSKEEIEKMSIRDLLAEESLEDGLAHFKKLVETGAATSDLWHKQKHGSKRCLTVNAVKLSETRILGFCKDITERKEAEESLKDTLGNLRKAFGTTVQVMVSAVETRDPYTAGHQLRSTDLARAIATEMNLPQDKIEAIRMAGPIHDIGKLSVPAELLSKPTKLTELEFSMIKEHANKGYEMLKDVESPWPLAQIVYQHHERMDGSGYPRHLKGEEILLEARILAVADVVESMASHRPYRPGLGIDAALAEIENNKGTLYDAEAVDACLKLFREKGYQLQGHDFER